MDQPLLENEHEDECLKWGTFFRELRAVGSLSGPMVAINLSQYVLHVISLMMVGHISQLALSGAALAVSFSSVSGFSPVFGMSTALETLCGQAYGAKQYQQFATLIQTGIFSLIAICFPILLLWVNMETILVLIGQDPTIAQEAGTYAICLIPALFGYATLQVQVRYFQMQSLIHPMVMCSAFTLCCHVSVCYALVFHFEIGSIGAAYATGISYWVNVLLLGLYMRFSPSCERTRFLFSMAMFKGVPQFVRLGLPSAVMICLEWWSFELLTLLAGLLPNPTLETSVLSVCLSAISTLYTIPEGIGGVASIRVSNALGSGRPRAAKVAVWAVIAATTIQSTIVSAVMYAQRSAFGYLFSNEGEVVSYVTSMAPLICVSVILDSFQATMSGISRGCGWQHLGAYANLVAYYLCGVPVALALAFKLKFGGRGLWIGIQVGSFLQNVLLFIITSGTDMKKQANMARERLFGLEKSACDGEC